MKTTDEGTKGYPLWVHKLVPPFRYGHFISGILIFILIWMVLGLVGGDISIYLKLFFVSMCAYIVPVFANIIEKTAVAYDEIAPLLDDSDNDQAIKRHAFTHRSGRWYFFVSLLAISFWCVHLIALGWSYDRNVMAVFSIHNNASAIGALLVWVLMMTTNFALVENAFLLGRLGRRIPVDLLRGSHQVAIARVAIVSTLSIIGAQSLFVLLMIDTNANWVSFLPGFVITCGPMLVLFLVPVLPLHHRLRDTKRHELLAIDKQIARLRPDSGVDLSDLSDLNQLLIYRREIRQVSEWPFDVPALTRLAFYLVLPPITWVAAALIENVVDALL